MTRRSALLALSSAMMSPGLMAQQTRPVIQTRRLNNVMIAVSNLERSTAFYVRLFGPPVRQGDTVVFRIGEGPHFFGLTALKSGAKPDFLSYGMTVADFDAEQVLRTLADLGVGGAQITRRGDTPELFVPDPNGIKIQLQHTTYGYGAGARGDIFPPAPTAVARSAFQLKSINHVTLTIAHGARILSDCVRSSDSRDAGRRRYSRNRRGNGWHRLQPHGQYPQYNFRHQSRVFHNRKFRRRASHGNLERQRSRTD
jgi:catechol 2,3-dioxygenase-like lactoylglutathione lyase family enzyme